LALARDAEDHGRVRDLSAALEEQGVVRRACRFDALQRSKRL